MTVCWWGCRELNLVRDECTEPVVRENLELQERLVALEQAKVDLEDRLTATRSEVRLVNSIGWQACNYRFASQC